MKRSFTFFRGLLLLLILSVLACSKSDSPTPAPPIVPDNSKNGGVLNRYEILTIPVTEALTQESYIGNIAGKEVTLVRLDEKNLGFMVDQNIPIGNHKLVVPGLKDFSYNFQISEKALTGTPEEVIQPLLTAFNSIAQRFPENQEASNGLKSISEVFNKANADQKAIMAKTYLANKGVIDTIINRAAINGNIQTVASMGIAPYKTSNVFSLDGMGWMDNEHKLRLIAKHMTAILIMTVTGTGAAIIRPPGWHTIVLAGVSAIAAISARDAVLEIAALTFYYTAFSMGIGPEYFQSAGNSKEKFMATNYPLRLANSVSNQKLIFVSGKDNKVGAAVSARTINNGDRSGTSQTVKDFFEKLGDLRNYFIRVNEAIEWSNKNIPFSNLTPFQIPDIGAESKSANVGVGQNALNQGLKLTINHQNIKVNKLSVSEPGALLLNLEIVNTQSTAIDTEIQYEYKDDFSNFSGVIPIKVEKELSLEGKWTMTQDRNGHQAGKEVIVNNTLCASIPAVKFTITGEVTFTKTTYAGARRAQQFNYAGALINPQTCELIKAGAFVANHINEAFSGTYTIANGKIADFKYFGTYYGDTIVLDVLDNNTISIDGNIYVRNEK